MCTTERENTENGGNRNEEHEGSDQKVTEGRGIQI